MHRRYVPEVVESEKLTHELRARLPAQFGAVDFYHGDGARGQLPQSEVERSRVLREFMSGSVSCVVATSAFGLGVNKRGIRQVVHIGPSRDFLCGYVQEIGRAGRGQVAARCTLLASSGDVTAIDRSNPEAADQMRRWVNSGAGACRWDLIRDAFGESRQSRWRCHHCDNCVSASRTAETISCECAPVVRVLLRALSEAQDGAAAGGAVSWNAVRATAVARGSQLEALRKALPRSTRSSLRTWLAEVLAVQTPLVDRITLVGSCTHSRPYDGFQLTPEGRAELARLEQLAVGGGAPSHVLPIPFWLLRHLGTRPQSASTNEHTEVGGGDSDGSHNESDDDDDERQQPHSGYTGSILPRPELMSKLSKGARVAVYYLPPHSNWFEGVVVNSGAKLGMKVKVRFDDGEQVESLAWGSYGRTLKWVLLPEAGQPSEVWVEVESDGHPLLSAHCRWLGRDAVLRMWCEARNLFVGSWEDDDGEFEISADEAEAAVQRRRGGDDDVPETEQPDRGSTGDAGATDAADALPSGPSSVAAAESSDLADVPWPLRWELERLRAQGSGWRESDAAREKMCAEWRRLEARNGNDSEAGAQSDDVRLRRHRERVTAVRKLLSDNKQLVLPFAPRGFVVRYRVRVSTCGAVELLEPRKDMRTFAHALFGEEAWLHIELAELPESSNAARERAKRAQLKVLRDGLHVCGRRFLFFGPKIGRSLDDTKAFFLAERGVLAETSAFFSRAWAAPGGMAAGGATAGSTREWAWDGMHAARGLMAAFGHMECVTKLSKRLALPFSGTQRGLDGFGCRVVDWRNRRGTAAACLPLHTGSPLCKAAGGTGRMVHIYIVDDVPATTHAASGGATAGGSSSAGSRSSAGGSDIKPRIMTDGSGLISVNLAAQLPSVAEGVLLPDANDEVDSSSWLASSSHTPLAPLGTQLRLYALGYLAKGTLVACHSLPGNVIVLTNSQVKVEPKGAADPVLAAARQHLFALEIIDQTREHKPRLNAQIIPILEAASGAADSAGRSRFHGHLQRLAAAEAEHVLKLQQPGASREQQLTAALRDGRQKGAYAHASRFGLGTPSVVEMIDAGMSVLHDPYLMSCCQREVDGALEMIRKGKIKLGQNCTVVMGFPDPTGTLREGEIFQVIDGQHTQPLALPDSCCGEGGRAWTDALIYRPPGVRASDVRRVKSVYCQQLVKELFGSGGTIDVRRASAVFFSVHGVTPLADMLAGGDYDGDRFYVLQDRDLLELCAGAPSAFEPSEASSEPTMTAAAAPGGLAATATGVASAPVGRQAAAAGSSSGALRASAASSSGSATAPTAAQPEAREACREAEMQLAFLEARHEASVAVGVAEVNHQAAADRFGLHSPIAKELAEIYLQLLDCEGNPKHQTQRVEQLRHKIGKRPEWMFLHRGGDRARYTADSSSALAHLQRCSLGDSQLALAGGRAGGSGAACGQQLQLDRHLRLDLHLAAGAISEDEVRQFKKKWELVRKAYRDRVNALHRAQELARQARVGSSSSSAAAESSKPWAAEPRVAGGAREYDDENEWRDKYYALVAQMREEKLLAEYACRREAADSECALCEPPKLLAEACALYEVVYGAAKEHGVTEQAELPPKFHVAFAWHMAGDLLLHVKKARRCREKDPSLALFTSCN